MFIFELRVFEIDLDSIFNNLLVNSIEAFNLMKVTRQRAIQVKVHSNGKEVVFKGNGWGHGCGMEQWGANVMAAENKKNARQIVEYYYPNTTLTTLYK